MTPALETLPLGIIDDEPSVLENLSKEIKKECGKVPFISQKIGDAVTWIKSGQVKVLVVDYNLSPTEKGINVIESLKNMNDIGIENIDLALFTRGVLPINVILKCNDQSIAHFDKKDKGNLPKNLLSLLDDVDQPMDLFKTGSENLQNTPNPVQKMKDLIFGQVKKDLINSLSKTNPKGTINLDLSKKITVEELTKEIENESTVGLDYIINFFKSKSKLRKMGLK